MKYLALALITSALIVGCANAPHQYEPVTESRETQSSEASLATYNGQSLYLNNCANCHGVHGEGDGVATPSLNVVLQDLRYLSARNAGSFPHEWLMELIDGRATRQAHGPQGMPVWGNVFARQEGFDAESNRRVTAKVQSLTDYLESIQVLSGDEGK